MQTTQKTIERFGRLVESELLKRNESTSFVIPPLSDDDMKHLVERIFVELAPQTDDIDEKRNRENYEEICVLLETNFLARYDDGIIQCHTLESFEKIQKMISLLRKHIPEVGDVLSMDENPIPSQIFTYDPKVTYVVDEDDEDITARNYADFFKLNVCIHGPLELTNFLDDYVNVFFKTTSAFGIPFEIAKKRFEGFVTDLNLERNPLNDTVMNVVLSVWEKVEHPRHAIRVLQSNPANVNDFSKKLEQFYPNKHPKPMRSIYASGASKHVSEGEVSSSKRLRVEN